MKNLLGAAHVAVFAVACCFAPSPSRAQIDLAPTLTISSSRGAIQNVDPLVDPDTFFLFANQTVASTLTIRSVRFEGPVHLTAVCCWEPSTKMRIIPNGIMVSVSPSDVTLARNGSLTSTLSVTTGAVPTAGMFLVRVTGTTRQPAIRVTTDVLLNVPMEVPVGVAVPACPRFFPAGSPPPPSPEVLPLAAVIRTLYATKEGSLTRTSFSVGAAATMSGNGWTITVDKATGLTTPLMPNESLVVFKNTRTWDKTLTSFDSRNCAAVGQIITLVSGATGSIRISMNDTTSLLLSRRVCKFWFLFCWDSGGSEDIAVFAEPAFWSLFGGRRVTISWDISNQQRGLIVIEK
jgi:hypothetical protein